MTEVALLLPVFLLMAMGLFDFGRAVFAYNAVSEAARNGARVAIVNQTVADICLVTAERAAGLGLPTTCAANATALGVWVTPNSSGRGCTSINSCIQTVQVTYRFTPITPIIGRLMGPIDIRAASKVPVESLCFNASCPRT